jgi:poly-gamma-glutamate capsule biosynthesis protein CapA/YwtB (metallophosphatase superfamily)
MERHDSRVQHAAGTITLMVTGDVMLGRLMNDVLRYRGPAYPWGNTLPLLRSADATLINLECVIAESGEPWTQTPKVFHFRASPLAIESLKIAGVDYVALANNHTLDYGEVALKEMLRRLDEAGIAHSGAGCNREEAVRPAILAVRGVRLAIISFTDNEPAWAAGPEKPGVNFVCITPTGEGVSTLKATIAAARQHADLVICSAHWGPNMRLRPTRAFTDFAHQLIDCGLDLFWGHSAHLFQGIEVYNGKPILYDTGDFVDDYAVDPELRNDWSMLVRMFATRQGVQQIDLLPVLISHFQVNLATDDAFEALCQRVHSLSSELGTSLEKTSEGLRVQL